MIKFTLLMCIYAKENPAFLAECLESIKKLTVKPDEILIVKDGPLPEELEAVLYKAQETGDANWTDLQLPENVTLGPARAAGVKAAKNEWIAIMDTDDICCPDRFEKQLQMIQDNPKLGLVGGQMTEFTDTPDKDVCNNKAPMKQSRVVPTKHNDIVKYAKLRNPFNHMTVMFRRDEVLSAGNYRLFHWFEDYDLWTRMIKTGTICANHQDILVEARVNAGTYNRRRGKEYIRCEWRMQKQLKELGIINCAELLRNILIRFSVRLLPHKLLAGVYRKVLRSNN